MDLYFPQLTDILRCVNKNQIQLIEFTQAMLQIQQLCKLKANIILVDLQFQRCFYCKIDIKQYQMDEYNTLPCGHVYHLKCLSQIAIQNCPNLDFENAYIECGFCQQLLTTSQIRKSVPTQFIQQREQYMLNQQAIKLEQEDRQLRQQQAMNKQFTCNICQDEKNINNEGRTLNCGCQFCEDCLREYALQKIKNGEFYENQIFCPNSCKKQGSFLDTFMIKDLLKDENEVYYQKMIDFRAKDYERDPNFKLIKCPGYLLKSQNSKELSIMKQNQIDDFRMKKISIPSGFTIHECQNMWEYDQRDNLKQTKCNICQYEFCLFGCEKTHQGFTCEQFKQWLIENSVVDQEFQKLVQRDKLFQCPKCQSYIQKNGGCNHMTCRRPGCGKEFCCVCLADHPCGKH
ncbi:RING-type zinc-finger, LisH dimerization motif protein (macronuclear) [Tetrahymena thermophila SB210]|uniref:RING-type zinc-finger, LisH dimerization motif protein n=1 Tax=Tetrahymena thermophila (strain SB210) TaxID=312017 RepID=I7M1G6_TETTS|nr:RING-type zinc-finger, LisH dimerization motif protein [Tetrahymena thermophila SB210]EAR96312.2 RING-type zinc-finger, LisH dimerization motif protein [Tetrahymena thermophila SB210]|eukprot:XP_001016557.2 RING-type zinc-finger, LisH dimerization motif protein [Tetrahymena thermophila SB210]